MKIDHDSPLPLHAQVEALVRGMLKETRYREGELLPPEAQIAETLGVCRNTVRSAIARLVQEGVLERRAGRGTRHVRQPVKTSLESWPSFTREMQSKGIEVEVFSCRVQDVKPTARLTRLLRLSTAEQRRTVVKMEQVRGYDGIPSVCSASWFHPRTGLVRTDDFTVPLYDLILGRSGIVPEFSDEEVSAALADTPLSAKLACRVGDPVLVRTRLVTDAGRNLIEYNENHYRADRFTYGLMIRRGGS